MENKSFQKKTDAELAAEQSKHDRPVKDVDSGLLSRELRAKIPLMATVKKLDTATIWCRLYKPWNPWWSFYVIEIDHPYSDYGLFGICHTLLSAELSYLTSERIQAKRFLSLLSIKRDRDYKPIPVNQLRHFILGAPCI